MIEHSIERGLLRKVLADPSVDMVLDPPALVVDRGHYTGLYFPLTTQEADLVMGLMMPTREEQA